MRRRGSARQTDPRAPADAPRRSFYGRRHGRRLRPGLQALSEELLPRVGIALPTGGQALDPAALFGPASCGRSVPTRRAGRVWLEIGFGSGEHLAWQAEHRPDTDLLGAEVFVNGIASLLRRIDDTGIENLRIFQGDGRDLLDVLPKRSLDRVFILFPDPWPKTRHHKRRIIQQDTLDRLAEAMKDGAELRLATDDMDYLRWMLERLIRHAHFEWLAQGPGDWRARPLDWPPTRYELKALRQGRRPVYLRFRRRPRGA